MDNGKNQACQAPGPALNLRWVYLLAMPGFGRQIERCAHGVMLKGWYYSKLLLALGSTARSSSSTIQTTKSV
jgi:hypothetical protein